MKFFSTFTLKIIAILFMTLDHIYTYFNMYTSIDIPIWFGYLGRLAAPIFFYLIVEGFFHTRSRKKYMKRLFSFAIVMIGIDLVLGIKNNIFLSLALSVALMSAIEYIKTQERGSRSYNNGIFSAVVIGVLSLFTEASIYGLLMTLIFYFLREKKNVMYLVYMVFSLSGLVGMVSMGESFMDAALYWDYQWMMVFATPFLFLYSGKRGLNNKYTKWMFYGFYPVHLVVIVVVSKIIGV